MNKKIRNIVEDGTKPCGTSEFCLNSSDMPEKPQSKSSERLPTLKTTNSDKSATCHTYFVKLHLLSDKLF